MIDRRHLASHALLGLVMGFGLSRIGFSDGGEVRRLFTLVDLRLLATFAGAVLLIAGGLALLDRRCRLASPWRHPGLFPGSILFGAGWAICGACPATALVQVGEGQLAALWTLVGVGVGTWIYGPIHRRLFRWDAGPCQ